MSRRILAGIISGSSTPSDLSVSTTPLRPDLHIYIYIYIHTHTYIHITIIQIIIIMTIIMIRLLIINNILNNIIQIFILIIMITIMLRERRRAAVYGHSERDLCYGSRVLIYHNVSCV